MNDRHGKKFTLKPKSYFEGVKSANFFSLDIKKNGPTGAVVRASPSYDNYEANWNGRTGRQADRQTDRTPY